MKNILLFTAVAALGLVWIGEKISAQRMEADLIRLRQQRAEMSSLLHKRDRMVQRLNDAQRHRKTPQEQPAPAHITNVVEPKALLSATLPLGDWVGVRECCFRGQATPQASIESALWAAAGGDMAMLKQLIYVSEETRAAANSLLASLPASSRMAYQGSEDLISALTIKRIPLGDAQLVWLNQNDSDHATACVFVRDSLNNTSALAPVSQNDGPSPPQLSQDNKTSIAYLALQRDGNRWLLAVPATAIGALAQELITTNKPAS